MAHLMDGLRLQGYSVSLVRPRQHSFDGSDYRYQPGATLVRSLPLPGYRGLHIGVPASAALRRCWTERRPDVIYVATQGPLGWSAVSTARQLGIPVFSGFHTNFDAYSKHYHAGWLRFLIWRYLSAFHNRDGRHLGAPAPSCAIDCRRWDCATSACSAAASTASYSRRAGAI